MVYGFILLSCVVSCLGVITSSVDARLAGSESIAFSTELCSTSSTIAGDVSVSQSGASCGFGALLLHTEHLVSQIETESGIETLVHGCLKEGCTPSVSLTFSQRVKNLLIEAPSNVSISEGNGRQFFLEGFNRIRFPFGDIETVTLTTHVSKGFQDGQKSVKDGHWRMEIDGFTFFHDDCPFDGAITIDACHGSVPVTAPPPDPRQESDRVFVTQTPPEVQSTCQFSEFNSSAGSTKPPFVTIPLRVTRYVGRIQSPEDYDALVEAKVISPTATLRIAAYDVDSSVQVSPATQYSPERDRVWFNGEEVGFLQGQNGQWSVTEFELPINKIRFFQYGGQDPSTLLGGSIAASPANNVIEIQIDADNAVNDLSSFCAAVAWAELRFEAMSPVILIHGNNSDGGFFDRNGFTKVLKTRRIPYNNAISMETSSIENNGLKLKTLIPDVVSVFGVDSAHLVVHSKGGLDTRQYLAHHHDSQNFEVLSYTSLSTPHNGSVLADLVVETTAALEIENSALFFPNFPTFAGTIAVLSSVDDGTRDLMTSATARFNAENVPRLSKQITFNTVSADADSNDSESIDLASEVEALGNDAQIIRELINTPLVGTPTVRLIDILYQTLRNTARIEVSTPEIMDVDIPGDGVEDIPVALVTLTSIPPPEPHGNDILVTLHSGQGIGQFDRLTKNATTFTSRGGGARNHSSVANEDVAKEVLEWIIDTERRNGDLNPL